MAESTSCKFGHLFLMQCYWCGHVWLLASPSPRYCHPKEHFVQTDFSYWPAAPCSLFLHAISQAQLPLLACIFSTSIFLLAFLLLVFVASMGFITKICILIISNRTLQKITSDFCLTPTSFSRNCFLTTALAQYRHLPIKEQCQELLQKHFHIRGNLAVVYPVEHCLSGTKSSFLCTSIASCNLYRDCT